MTFFTSLLVALCLHQASSISYDGSECTRLVEFDLSNTTNVTTLDGYVAKDLSSIPVYTTYSCKAALRRYFCLATYTHKATSSSTTMCAGVCEEVLTSCGKLLDEFADSSSSILYLYDLVKACAADDPTLSCVNGSSDAYFAQDEPQCFYQTVATDAHGANFPLEPSACALPCPGRLFHEIYSSWQTLFAVLTFISAITACLTTYQFTMKYQKQKKDISIRASGISSLRSATVFPVLMFCVGGSIHSLVNFMAVIEDMTQPECDGNAKWSASTPICFLQSAALLGTGLWSSCWSFVMAFETWSITFLPRFSRRQKIRAWYLPVAVLVTTCCVLTLQLSQDGVQKFDVPFCAPKRSRGSGLVLENEVVGIPISILVGFSSLMLLGVVFKIIQMESNVERSSVEDQERCCGWLAPIRPSKIVLYRIFLLVLCYNFYLLFIFGISFAEQLQISEHKRNAKVIYSCLLKYAVTNPEIGKEHCGDSAEANITAPLWTLTVYVIVEGTFGMIPFLVFGVDYQCKIGVFRLDRWKALTGWTGGARSQSKKTPSRPQQAMCELPQSDSPSLPPQHPAIPSPRATTGLPKALENCTSTPSSDSASDGVC